MAGLLDDLNDLEAVESPSFTVASQDLKLADFAQQAIKMLHAKAQAKSIELIGPVGSGETTARGDAKRVLQVLLNLAGNAINYSPEGSTVTIGVSDSMAGRATISVSDEGPGLSPEQQERVFAKFERLGRSGDGGSGLGLYISRRLAEAMSGALSVESTPKEGATFTLALPVE